MPTRPEGQRRLADKSDIDSDPSSQQDQLVIPVELADEEAIELSDLLRQLTETAGR